MRIFRCLVGLVVKSRLLRVLHPWVYTTSAVECILYPTSGRTKVSERGKFKQKGKTVLMAVLINALSTALFAFQ